MRGRPHVHPERQCRIPSGPVACTLRVGTNLRRDRCEPRLSDHGGHADGGGCRQSCPRQPVFGRRRGPNQVLRWIPGLDARPSEGCKTRSRPLAHRMPSWCEEDEVYLHFPNGVARSKLTNDYLDRTLGTVSTVRNWRTVCKLHEMAVRAELEHCPVRIVSPRDDD